MYAITALSNSTGFYDSFSPIGSPVAVGYKAPQVNASDFPYAGLVHPTAVGAFTPIAAAVTGMNVTYLVIP